MEILARRLRCNIIFYIHDHIVGVIFKVSDEHLLLSALESQAQLLNRDGPFC